MSISSNSQRNIVDLIQSVGPVCIYEVSEVSRHRTWESKPQTWILFNPVFPNDHLGFRSGEILGECLFTVQPSMEVSLDPKVSIAPPLSPEVRARVTIRPGTLEHYLCRGFRVRFWFRLGETVELRVSICCVHWTRPWWYNDLKGRPKVCSKPIRSYGCTHEPAMLFEKVDLRTETRL